MSVNEGVRVGEGESENSFAHGTKAKNPYALNANSTI